MSATQPLHRPVVLEHTTCHYCVLRWLEPITVATASHGFGGALPESFRKLAYEQDGKGPLEVWGKETN